jgi:hypothetical protein
MNFERRNFLRVSTAGLAGTVFNLESALAQEVQRPEKSPGPDAQHQDTSRKRAEFRSGSGSLSLYLKLNSGTLDVHADNFNRGRDAGAILAGTFTPSKGDAVALYRSYFCVDGARQVFCRLGDDDHWTSLVLATTADADVYSLTLWQDAGLPEMFRFSKKAFLAVASAPGRPDPQKYILDDRGPALKPDGSRKPPNITMEELINVLDDDRDYLAFVRGKRLSHQHATHAVFACFFYTKVFDAILGPVWEGAEF